MKLILSQAESFSDSMKQRILQFAEKQDASTQIAIIDLIIERLNASQRQENASLAHEEALEVLPLEARPAISE